jgi:hypothetical protein
MSPFATYRIAKHEQIILTGVYWSQPAAASFSGESVAPISMRLSPLRPQVQQLAQRRQLVNLKDSLCDIQS